MRIIIISLFLISFTMSQSTNKNLGTFTTKELLMELKQDIKELRTELKQDIKENRDYIQRLENKVDNIKDNHLNSLTNLLYGIIGTLLLTGFIAIFKESITALIKRKNN